MSTNMINDVKIISPSGTYIADIGAKAENVTLSTPIIIDGVTCNTLLDVLTVLNTKKLDNSSKGASNGVAELDSDGKIIMSQIPGAVNILEKYATESAFPATGSDNVLYVALDTNFVYRWTGVSYVQIDASIQLGETAATAYRGDRGKTAYDHSQLTSGNPHNVTKTDLGLGDVGNYKAVSTAADQGLSNTEQRNSRRNIGASTVAFDQDTIKFYF